MKYKLTRSLLFTLAMAVGLSLSSSECSFGQGPAEHTSVELTGDGDGDGGDIEDWFIFPFGQTGVVDGALGFQAQDSPFSQFNIVGNAQGGSLTIAAQGTGIGFGVLLPSTTADSRLALAPLHVVGGGGDDAYGAARVFIEDRNPANASYELMRLKSAGTTNLVLESTALANEAQYNFQAQGGRLDVLDGLSSTVPITISKGPTATVRISQNGVGIGSGLATPVNSALHVFSNGSNGDSSTITSQVAAPAATRSRTMLNLVNNGAPSMTFTDSSIGSTWFFSNTNDELNLRKGGTGLNPGFIVEADGEFRFVRDNVAEAPRLKIDVSGNLLIPGQVITVSDRGKKENIKPVDTLAVLNKVVGMPVSTWNYTQDDKKVPHMGPMAQDFNAAFDLGAHDKMIGEMDKNGVTIAAVQGLNQKLEASNESLSQKVDSQQVLIDDQFALIKELQARMEQLESSVASQQN